MLDKDVEKLLEKQTVSNYKKAAKIIVDNNLTHYCDPLVEYIDKLLIKRKSFDAICSIIEAIGLLQCSSAITILEKICNENIEHDLITIYASKAYIRLTRKDSADVRQIIHFFENKGTSVKHGALNALGYDKMIPSLNDQEKLIEICWDLGSNREQGLADPRYGLAAACAGWSANRVDAFLEHCLESCDEGLKYVASNSLKRKYVKLR